MIADKGCAERGCACYDDRLGEVGVEMVRRQWVELTEEEVEACNRFTTDWGASCVWLWDDAFEEGGRQFVRAIEAKLKEKNT